MTLGRTDPTYPYVSGRAGRWLPGLVAGAGPAGWTGVDASRVTLGPGGASEHVPTDTGDHTDSPPLPQ